MRAVTGMALMVMMVAMNRLKSSRPLPGPSIAFRQEIDRHKGNRHRKDQIRQGNRQRIAPLPQRGGQIGLQPASSRKRECPARPRFRACSVAWHRAEKSPRVGRATTGRIRWGPAGCRPEFRRRWRVARSVATAGRRFGKSRAAGPPAREKPESCFHQDSACAHSFCFSDARPERSSIQVGLSSLRNRWPGDFFGDRAQNVFHTLWVSTGMELSPNIFPIA